LDTALSPPAPNSPGVIDLCCDHGKDETSNNEEEDCLLLDWNWRPVAGVFHSEWKQTQHARIQRVIQWAPTCTQIQIRI